MFQYLRVNPASYIPVSLQFKEQLKQMILGGRLAAGGQLPSVRQLAGFLRINRNTVVRALAELELEGYVCTHHGKGVFVTERLPDREQAMALQRLVEETFQRATVLGLNPHDCALALLAQAQLRTHAESAAQTELPLGPHGRDPARHDNDGRRSPHLLLLECNDPALRLYQRDLEAELGARVDAILIAELQQRLTAPHFAARYTLAVTTFFHVEEVEALLAPWKLRVVALLAEASLETLFRLMRLPTGTPIGVVCENREATENMQRSLERAELGQLQVIQATLDDQDALTRMLPQVRVVVTSVDCAETVQQLAPHTEVIVEDRRVDRGALDMLRRLLA